MWGTRDKTIEDIVLTKIADIKILEKIQDEIEEVLISGDNGVIERIRNMIVGNASDAFDTLEEVDRWIENHQEVYEGLVQRIKRIRKIAETELKKTNDRLDKLEDLHHGDVEEINEALNNILNDIKKSKDAIRKALVGVQTEMHDAVNGLAAETQEGFTNVNGRIDKLKKIYDEKFVGIQTRITDVTKEIVDKYDAEIAGVQGQIKGVQSETTDKIADAVEGVQTEFDNKIDDAVDTLNKHVSNLRKYVDGKIDTTKDELTTEFDKKIDDVNETIEELSKTEDDHYHDMLKEMSDVREDFSKHQTVVQDAINNEAKERRKGDIDLNKRIDDVDKSIRDDINDALAKHTEDIAGVQGQLDEAITKILKDGFSEDLDSFREVAEWISGHQTEYNSLVEMAEVLGQQHTADIAEIKDNAVFWTKESLGDRKHILLDNHNMLMGVITDTPANGGYQANPGNCNLAMVNKWNVADFGSTQIPINLNGIKGERPTYNDTHKIALLEDVEGAQGTILEVVKGVQTEFAKDLADAVEGVQTEFAKNLEGVQSELEKSIKGVQTNLEGVQSELKDALDRINTDLNSKIVGVQGELKNDLNGVQTVLEKSIDGVQTDLVENYVPWTHDGNRDHIVLTNHSMLEGTATDTPAPGGYDEVAGGTYNLAMVNKWNVADFGSSKLPINLNGLSVEEGGRPTYNDTHKIVILEDLVGVQTKLENAIGSLTETVESLETDLSDTKDELNTSIADAVAGVQTEFAGIQGEIEKTIKGVQKDLSGVQGQLEGVQSVLEGKISGVQDDVEDVNESVKNLRGKLREEIEGVQSRIDGVQANYVHWSKDSHNGRSIVLPNYSMIVGEPNTTGVDSNGNPLGIDADGNCNLVMLSQWNVVDLGSTKYPINLNGPKVDEGGRPTYNDDYKIALLKDLDGVQTDLKDKLDVLATEVGAQATRLDGKIDTTKTNLEDEIKGVQNRLLDKINKNAGDIYTIETEVIPGVQSKLKKYIDDVKESLLGGATEAFDTLKEVESWIETHGTDYSSLLTDLNGIHSTLDGLDGDVKGVQGELYEMVKGVQSETSTKITSAVNDLNNKIDGVQSDLVENYVPWTHDGNRDHIVLNNHSMLEGVATANPETGGAEVPAGHYNLAMVNKWNVADFGSHGLPINLNGSKDRPTYNDTKDIALLSDVQGVQSDVKKNYVPWEFGENERKFIVLPNHCMLEGTATATPETDGEFVEAGNYNLAMVNKWNVADFGSSKLPINLNGLKPRPTYNDKFDIALMDDVTKLEDKVNDVQGSLDGYVTKKDYDEKVAELNNTIKSLTDKLADVEKTLAEWAENLVIAVNVE